MKTKHIHMIILSVTCMLVSFVASANDYSIKGNFQGHFVDAASGSIDYRGITTVSVDTEVQFLEELIRQQPKPPRPEQKPNTYMDYQWLLDLTGVNPVESRQDYSNWLAKEGIVLGKIECCSL